MEESIQIGEGKIDPMMVLIEGFGVIERRTKDEELEAEREFCDKVWYNRHCNLLHMVESGEIRVIPEGSTETGPSIIHENILEGAKVCAEKVIEKYGEIEPFTDFEWGMLNGKLSAIRWMHGEEWDSLYT